MSVSVCVSIVSGHKSVYEPPSVGGYEDEGVTRRGTRGDNGVVGGHGCDVSV